MESVGSFEAKTHLPQLLERVAQGEEFTITKHGKPVARLVPAVPAKPKPDVRQVIEELKAFSGQHARRGPHHPGSHRGRTPLLTGNDAAYLELAIRLGLPLAYLDGNLKTAAAAAGVVLFSPP